MIIDIKFLNKLKVFGINSYEAKIWAALLSRGVSSAGELSDISNVPRSRAYDVLESLEKKGFIVMKIGKPIKYIAVHPEEVLDRVKKNLNDAVEKKVKMVDDIRNDEILGELNTLYSQGIEIIEPTELTGALRDRGNVYNNLNLMIKNAEKSIICMTTSKGLTRKADVLRKSLEKAKARGVQIKFAAPIDKDSEKAAQALSRFGEVKHIDEIKARFCIVDSKQVLFNLMDDEKTNPAYDAGIWVNTEFFSTALEGMFNTVWDSSKAIV